MMLNRFAEEIKHGRDDQPFIRAIQRLIVAFAIEEEDWDVVEENLQFWKEAGYEPQDDFWTSIGWDPGGGRP